MTINYCDICGSQICPGEHGRLANGALAVTAKVEHICKACSEIASAVDWCEVVRDAWREVGYGNKGGRGSNGYGEVLYPAHNYTWDAISGSESP